MGGRHAQLELWLPNKATEVVRASRGWHSRPALCPVTAAPQVDLPAHPDWPATALGLSRYRVEGGAFSKGGTTDPAPEQSDAIAAFCAVFVLPAVAHAHPTRTFQVAASIIDYLLKPFGKDRLILASAREGANCRATRQHRGVEVPANTARAQTQSSRRCWCRVTTAVLQIIIDTATGVVELDRADDGFTCTSTPARALPASSTCCGICSAQPSASASSLRDAQIHGGDNGNPAL